MGCQRVAHFGVDRGPSSKRTVGAAAVWRARAGAGREGGGLGQGLLEREHNHYQSLAGETLYVSGVVTGGAWETS